MRVRGVTWEGGAHKGGCKMLYWYLCMSGRENREGGGQGLGYITNATHEQSTPNGDSRWYKFLLFLFGLGIGNWFLGYNMISGYTISGASWPSLTAALSKLLGPVLVLLQTTLADAGPNRHETRNKVPELDGPDFFHCHLQDRLPQGAKRSHGRILCQGRDIGAGEACRLSEMGKGKGVV